jgi:hypothetical protein
MILASGQATQTLYVRPVWSEELRTFVLSRDAQHSYFQLMDWVPEQHMLLAPQRTAVRPAARRRRERKAASTHNARLAAPPVALGQEDDLEPVMHFDCV